jgi:hypothetical protein
MSGSTDKDNSFRVKMLKGDVSHRFEVGETSDEAIKLLSHRKLGQGVVRACREIDRRSASPSSLVLLMARGITLAATVGITPMAMRARRGCLRQHADEIPP